MRLNTLKKVALNYIFIVKKIVPKKQLFVLMLSIQEKE